MRRLVVLLVLAACHHEPTAAELIEAGDRQLAAGSVGDLRGAVATFERALGRTGDPATQAGIHVRLAEAQRVIDKPRRLESLRRAQALAEKAGDPDLLFVARARVAAAGDEPVAPLQKIVAEARAAGLAHAEAAASAFLGSAMLNAGAYNDAIPPLTRALELVKAAPDVEVELRAQVGLGSGYLMLGDGERSVPLLERALALARAHRRTADEARALDALGGAHMWATRDRVRALVFHSAALATLERLGQGHLEEGINTRLNMARAIHFLWQPATAVAELQVVLDDTRAAMRTGLATDAMLVDALLALGPAAADARLYDEARAVYDEAIPLARKLGDPHRTNGAIIEAARLAVKQRRWSDAAGGIESVIASVAAEQSSITDEQLRFSYDQTLRNVTAVLLDARAGAGDWNGAFQASEQMRSRRLLEALGSDVFVDGAGAQALLDADTTLVEYVLGDGEAYALVVDAHGVRGTPLGNARNLGQLAKVWYDQASAVPPPPELEATTRRLADRLLTPILPQLGGRRLLIVPDKGLHAVAFAALPLPDGKALIERYELVHVASASVLRALRGRKDTRPRPTLELAVLADPIFDRTDERMGGARPAALVALRAGTAPAQEGGPADVPRLPSTHAEAQAIAALVPSARTYVAEGAEATRAAALGPEVAGARYVHLATHALLDNADPSRTGLVFTQLDEAGKPIDGFVRVADIEKAQLAADMVVLSACRTAFGKAFDGEGLVGLTRAFVRAGVPRVVSSLWQVDDEATAALMARFYRGFLAEGASPPAALRRAQLEIGVKPGAAMRLWAGFAFYGDWR